MPFVICISALVRHCVHYASTLSSPAANRSLSCQPRRQAKGQTCPSDRPLPARSIARYRANRTSSCWRSSQWVGLLQRKRIGRLSGLPVGHVWAFPPARVDLLGGESAGRPSMLPNNEVSPSVVNSVDMVAYCPTRHSLKAH